MSGGVWTGWRVAAASAKAESARGDVMRTPGAVQHHLPPHVDVMMLPTTGYQTRRHMGTWLALAKRGFSGRVEVAD